jgi:hypothetical protein
MKAAVGRSFGIVLLARLMLSLSPSAAGAKGDKSGTVTGPGIEGAVTLH